MRFRNLLMTLGFLVIAIQFLGFPRAWDSAFYVLLGLLVIAFAYLAGKREEPAKIDARVASEASVQGEIKA